MGKGSVPRPFDVPHDKFKDNWDAIFGKKKDEPKQEENADSNAPKENAK